ncbi:MAG: TonB-dependent receptor [Campylobacterota bacterium]|nr:TonB-dependent receptor [Campylobacterota bacterium]
MKKTLLLSLVACALLGAAETELESVQIEATSIDDVEGKDVQSADLAEAISREVPSISMVRRSGISNDIVLRGQKRDNINITIDNAKVCGACPNRMDPPTSHVLTNNIESIEIIEGPYDVEDFGTLSGAVKVKTKEPTKGFHGQIDLNAGSFTQRKASATLSGGTDMVQVLISASTEKSGQYKDGNGDTLAEQVDNYAAENPLAAKYKYQEKYHDMDAYSKDSLMAKVFFHLTDDQLLKLSYTANRSDDIMYPSSPMDAIRDDSNIYDIEYSIRNLGAFSKKLELQAYHSDVDHPMSNEYRMASQKMGAIFSNELTTDMDGFKVKNATDLTNNTELLLGLDASRRNWDGDYKKNGNIVGTSISSTDTENMAIFAQLEQDFSALHVSYGLRFDSTSVSPEEYNRPQGIIGNDPWQSNDYQDFSANVYGTYALSNSAKFFGGIGKGSRVPDARELYILGKPITDPADPNVGKQVQIGTPDLKSTSNYQIDLGSEYTTADTSTKVKVFYNKLQDYIYYNSTKMGANKFTNIDASIYGAEISGSYFITDNAYFDLGLAYQRGQKDEALAGQSDTNLADIPPLKGRLAYFWEYQNDSKFKIEGLAADTWNNYDADNGEQELGAYAILNLKLDHQLDNGFGIAVGVDNVTDQTYAISNTYKDLILVTGDPKDEAMLINEPGRYFYANVSYKF